MFLSLYITSNVTSKKKCSSTTEEKFIIVYLLYVRACVCFHEYILLAAAAVVQIYNDICMLVCCTIGTHTVHGCVCDWAVVSCVLMCGESHHQSLILCKTDTYVENRPTPKLTRQIHTHTHRVAYTHTHTHDWQYHQHKAVSFAHISKSFPKCSFQCAIVLPF